MGQNIELDGTLIFDPKAHNLGPFNLSFTQKSFCNFKGTSNLLVETDFQMFLNFLRQKEYVTRNTYKLIV